MMKKICVGSHFLLRKSNYTDTEITNWPLQMSYHVNINSWLLLRSFSWKDWWAIQKKDFGAKWKISVTAKCAQYQQWNSWPKDIPESSELCIGTFSQLQSCCTREYFCGFWRTWRKMKSLMEASSNLDPSGKQKANICKVCGKEGQGKVIKDHIEANHLEGVIIPCNICKKTFRCRNSFRKHAKEHQN